MAKFIITVHYLSNEDNTLHKRKPLSQNKQMVELAIFIKLVIKAALVNFNEYKQVMI